MNKELIFLTLALLVLSSCSTFQGARQPSPGDAPRSGVETRPAPRYLDFDDILLPREMDLVPDKSLLFETPGVKAGLLVFQGRVEPASLFDFFMANMRKDNWQLRSYFKYTPYILVFEKPDRDCVISLEEGALHTELQIWVTPRYSGAMEQPGETVLTR